MRARKYERVSVNSHATGTRRSYSVAGSPSRSYSLARERERELSSLARTHSCASTGQFTAGLVCANTPRTLSRAAAGWLAGLSSLSPPLALRYSPLLLLPQPASRSRKSKRRIGNRAVASGAESCSLCLP